MMETILRAEKKKIPGEAERSSTLYRLTERRRPAGSFGENFFILETEETVAY